MSISKWNGAYCSGLVAALLFFFSMSANSSDIGVPGFPEACAYSDEEEPLDEAHVIRLGIVRYEYPYGWVFLFPDKRARDGLQMVDLAANAGLIGDLYQYESVERETRRGSFVVAQILVGDSSVEPIATCVSEPISLARYAPRDFGVGWSWLSRPKFIRWLGVEKYSPWKWRKHWWRDVYRIRDRYKDSGYRWTRSYDRYDRSSKWRDHDRDGDKFKRRGKWYDRRDRDDDDGKGTWRDRRDRDRDGDKFKRRGKWYDRRDRDDDDGRGTWRDRRDHDRDGDRVTRRDRRSEKQMDRRDDRGGAGRQDPAAGPSRKARSMVEKDRGDDGSKWRAQRAGTSDSEVKAPKDKIKEKERSDRRARTGKAPRDKSDDKNKREKKDKSKRR